MAPIKTKSVKSVSKKLKNVEKKRFIKETTKPKEEEPLPPPVRYSDDPPPKKRKWINKQRILVFASRGITHRDRHLMEDLRGMMPHARPDSKMERKDNLAIATMKNCNKCIFFECKKKQDLYMWISNVSEGPSAKFLIQNVYTMGEMKLTGNCLKGSRPLLSFDPSFETDPHFQLLKEMFIQVFGTPNHHPRSQPFFDHVLSFSALDNRIWFRNYQIVSEDGSLAEIGPRFVLNPIKIFEGSFGGTVIWDNPNYKSPNMHRLMVKKVQGNKYEERIQAKLRREANQLGLTYEPRPLDDIFHGDVLEAALALEAQQQNAECEMATLPDEGSNKPGKPKKAKKAKKAPEGKIVKKRIPKAPKKKISGQKKGKKTK